ncbi:hypothetical protein ASPCADRAFT_207580 [Aspergillus carbonarius ITEM 5010]|uniref:Uncharacterized protein n=1 Tax=Aspergillus carbonarius (strain ITEM 5010) TaxID=602072 RepID=A0A1R3RP29_ASPC5|nr:hypothetical protein ASPCADRAFT_207580 [Aspergillus carbonarius ITEM 5010]
MANTMKAMPSVRLNDGTSTHSPRAIHTSLRKLQLSYIDLGCKIRGLIGTVPQVSDSSPFFATLTATVYFLEAWASMEGVNKCWKGAIDRVPNSLQGHLEALLKTAINLPSINQIELYPYLQHDNLLQFHEYSGITTASS